ncbi:MAG: SAM-dependent methyltransferase, partial [Stackebrandtia sp.]
YLAEFHPVCYALDSETGRTVKQDYFTTAPDVWEATGTYADWTARTRHNTVVEFQHTLGTIVTALARAGLRLDFLHEHDFTLFRQFQQLRGNDDGTLGYSGEGRVPLMYSLKATR